MNHKEMRTERFDALQRHVGLNAGNYIIHGVSEDICLFSDYTNGKEAVGWLFERYFPGEHLNAFIDDYDCRSTRLVEDMQHLGHIFCGIISKEYYDTMSIPKLRIPLRKSIRRGKNQPNTLVAGNGWDDRGYAKATMNMLMSALEEVGFVQLKEHVIYEGIVDSKGNIKTPHNRIVMTPNALFVSHPLCCRCEGHTGSCMAFIEYERAEWWADYENSICDNCMTDEEREMMESYDSCEWDDPETGMATECPMR